MDCSVKRPIKELINFEKIELTVGEAREIVFVVSKEQLSFYDEETAAWKFENGEFELHIGSSVSDIRLKGNFKM